MLLVISNYPVLSLCFINYNFQCTSSGISIYVKRNAAEIGFLNQATLSGLIKGIRKISLILKILFRRGSTQREGLATRSVEKNLELIFSILTPPILVPK